MAHPWIDSGKIQGKYRTKVPGKYSHRGSPKVSTRYDNQGTRIQVRVYRYAIQVRDTGTHIQVRVYRYECTDTRCLEWCDGANTIRRRVLPQRYPSQFLNSTRAGRGAPTPIAPRGHSLGHRRWRLALISSPPALVGLAPITIVAPLVYSILYPTDFRIGPIFA
eukprot:SAG11_NODE_8815_length_974_cov_2.009153_1_plen_163_part_10